MTAHQRDERFLVQLVSREDAAIRLRGLRWTLLGGLQRAELHQTIDVHSLEAIAMLDVPITDGFAVEEIAAIPVERLLEIARRIGLLSLRRTHCVGHLAAERADVEVEGQRWIDAIALAARNNPVRGPERFAQPVQSDVKIVAQLRRARIRPERQPDLLFRSAFGMHQQIDEQLAWTRRTPRADVDGLVVHKNLQWPQRKDT